MDKMLLFHSTELDFDLCPQVLALTLGYISNLFTQLERSQALLASVSKDTEYANLDILIT